MRSCVIPLLRPLRPAPSGFHSFLNCRVTIQSPAYLALVASVTTAVKKTPARPVSKPTQTSSNNRSASSPSSSRMDANQHLLLDPQAAIPQAATVYDEDPNLTTAIPTPSKSLNGNDSFTTTLSGNTQAANGNGSDGSGSTHIDWSSSFHGLSTTPFSAETSAVLMAPIAVADIEIKPDGIIYLPEIKYRRILNQAFGPGGWGLAPRGELVVGEKVVTREYALIVHGRFIAQARGECQYFSEETIPTAGEGCKSNALLRCCKDLGIASELWDPRFIREFKKQQCQEIWVEHVINKKRRQIWTRKDCDPGYPFKAVK